MGALTGIYKTIVLLIRKIIKSKAALIWLFKIPAMAWKRTTPESREHSSITDGFPLYSYEDKRDQISFMQWLLYPITINTKLTVKKILVKNKTMK